jgi:hypothetical protein
MFKRIDRSPRLAKFIEFLSTFMAKRRGLPVVIGVVLVVISLFIQAMNVYAQVQLLELVGVITLHTGILAALLGLLLAEPLGK